MKEKKYDDILTESGAPIYTSESGVFGDWLPFLVDHPLSVPVVGRDQQSIASLLTCPLDLTNGSV